MNDHHLRILRYFDYDHLPIPLQEVSQPFQALAIELAQRDADPIETSVALRKLLEAKDAAVRAALPANRATEPTPLGD